jgi:hypothetical protein
MTTCFVQAAGSIELYFYGELDDAARRETEQHLSVCAECRQALDDLAVIRTVLSARPDVAAPPGGDWTAFMTRLDASIRRTPESAAADGAESHAAPARPRLTVAPRRHYAAYIAMAALLALVTMSVAFIARSRVAIGGGAPSIAGSPRETPPWTDDEAFASLSEQHFDRAKLVVLGLANKEPGEGLPAEWEYERELASTLLADTRLYRLAAADRGMTQLARIMGDLELVLLQASLSQDPQPETLAQIQSLIRKRDLVTRMAAAY